MKRNTMSKQKCQNYSQIGFSSCKLIIKINDNVPLQFRKIWLRGNDIFFRQIRIRI